MNCHSVYAGAVGWAHASWRGDFYAEDLPEDWQLSFYNTQFRCVYLPHAQWKNATDAEVVRWLDDTLERFRFVLGAPETFDGQDAAKARRFGERGLAESQLNIVWIEGEADLRDLAQRMQKAAQGGSPLFLISRDAALGQLRQVGELMEVLGV